MLQKEFLILGGLFALLWQVTTPVSTYETVDGDVVRTRNVFLLLTFVCVGFWFAVKFYFAR